MRLDAHDPRERRGRARDLFENHSDLDLRIDPKLSWALRHPEAFPIDVNSAPHEHLLRVPGFGRRSVGRILRARRHARLGPGELRRLGAALRVAQYFIVTAGGRPRGAVDRLTPEHFLGGRSLQQRLPFFAELS